MKKSTEKWWREGKKHIKGKAIIRAVAKKYGASCVEEERFPVDLHQIEPELWPHKAMRGYQADLLITKRHGKQLYQVIAEIDGKVHEDRREEDELRDKYIKLAYNIEVVHFSKERLLKGGYREEEIARLLGLAPLVTGRGLYSND